VTVYIFVEGGLVQEALGTEDYQIIDMDAKEMGCCPVCGRDIEYADLGLYCEDCGIAWDNDPSYEEIVKFVEALDG
jgi:predicted amidophosphoribosyltransferase